MKKILLLFMVATCGCNTIITEFKKPSHRHIIDMKLDLLGEMQNFQSGMIRNFYNDAEYKYWHDRHDAADRAYDSVSKLW